MTNIIKKLSLSILVSLLYVQSPDSQLKEADSLFVRRDDLESLKRAVTIAQKTALAAEPNYDALWRLAKFTYYLADRESDKARQAKLFRSGADAAKKAVAADAGRVEGHFWLAANLGELADLKGALESLGMVKTIRKEFEAALAADPAYNGGAIYLALGQIDLQLPGLFGGSDRRGLARLEAGLTAGPNNAELKIALAEVYATKNKQNEARQLLESAIATDDPLRSPSEMRDLRTKARKGLDEIR